MNKAIEEPEQRRYYGFNLSVDAAAVCELGHTGRKRWNLDFVDFREIPQGVAIKQAQPTTGCADDATASPSRNDF